MFEISRTRWPVTVTLLALAAACGTPSSASHGTVASGGRENDAGGSAAAGEASGAGAGAGTPGAGGNGTRAAGGAGGNPTGSSGGAAYAAGAAGIGRGGRGNGGSGTAAGAGAGGKGTLLGGGAGTGTNAGGAGGSGTNAGAGGSAGGSHAVIQYVFVVPMENHDQGEVVGNAKDAPYINDTLLPAYASASNFVDQFALSTPSEPHYVWMEAGTNVFADHTFTGDDVPSAANSTENTAHLVTQIANATSAVSWRSYQQGLSDVTGACPIAADGHYVPRHDPFVFFQDVAGSPPSKTNAYCAQHHSAIEALSTDLTSGNVASYDFVTPDLCNDMHGQSGCPDSNLVHAGDTWLAATVPSLVSFANQHSGVVFIVWDEGDSTTKMPFIAAGPGVRAGYASPVKYTHGSLLKSVEEILGLPVLPAVAGESDFADLFEPGQFP